MLSMVGLVLELDLRRTTADSVGAGYASAASVASLA